jgi:hypothetical protein
MYDKTKVCLFVIFIFFNFHVFASLLAFGL